MSVPNQRKITVKKMFCDKNNKYTVNRLEALDKAANLLQSKAGFKLYMYLAKNQNDYKFYLSSSDFMSWAGVAYTAYTSAFNQLIQKGFLIQIQNKTNFIFCDYPNSYISIEKSVNFLDQNRQEEANFRF